MAGSKQAKTVGRIIREAVVADETIGADDLGALLAREGHRSVKRGTIDSYRSDALAVLAVARELGRLRGVPRARQPRSKKADAAAEQQQPEQASEPG